MADEKGIKITGYEELSTEKKTAYWSTWSSKNYSFPQQIEQIAQDINSDKNLDINNGYGYTIAYYMFMEDWEREQTEDYFEVDYFGYQVLYPSKM